MPDIVLPGNPALAPVTDGVPMPQRVWAILTIALGLTLAVLDGGIANVALPTIAREVNSSAANSIWVVNAYQLAVTISLLPLSSLGEIYGYKRIYQGGLILFTVASLACAMSSSLTTLILARMLQGFGAAGIMSVNSALIRFIYPRRWIGRGVGLNATVGSIASALGPTVAAAILSVALLLDHLGLADAATRIDEAVVADLSERGSAPRSTAEIGDAIAARVKGQK